MSKFLHGSIIRRFEVTKLGKRNQLYLLDNNELEFVYNELKEVLDLDIFDIIVKNNTIQGVLKDGVIDNNFKDLVKEFDFVCDLKGEGFVYDEIRNVEHATYIDELIYGNMCSFISEKLEREGYHIQLYTSAFIMDYSSIGESESTIVTKLLTNLSRKAILNKLSSALVFAVN